MNRATVIIIIVLAVAIGGYLYWSSLGGEAPAPEAPAVTPEATPEAAPEEAPAAEPEAESDAPAAEGGTTADQ